MILGKKAPLKWFEECFFTEKICHFLPFFFRGMVAIFHQTLLGSKLALEFGKLARIGKKIGIKKQYF